MTTRDEIGNDLHEGDMFFMFDCSFPFNMSQLNKCFLDSDGAQLSRCSKTIYITYDEDSVRSRRGWRNGHVSRDSQL